MQVLIHTEKFVRKYEKQLEMKQKSGIYEIECKLYKLDSKNTQYVVD